MATFILVHGSFHGAWCWQSLLPLLDAAGHRSVTLDLPASGDDPAPPDTAGLASYTDAVVRRIQDVAASDGAKPILVGHSMGAIVASQAAEQCADQVAGVVFVNGLLLRSGETLKGFLDEFAHLGVQDLVLANMRVSDDGRLATFPLEAAPDVFYHRCDPAQAAWAASRLRPQPTAVYGDPLHLTPERFGRVRRFYVEGRDDRAVSPTYQRLMVERTPCEHVFSLDGDHSPFLAMPQVLADVLADVAGRLAIPLPS